MNVYVIVFVECCAAALALFMSLVVLSEREKNTRAILRADINEWLQYENDSVRELGMLGLNSALRAQLQRELSAARYIVKCLKGKLRARTRLDICF